MRIATDHIVPQRPYFEQSGLLEGDLVPLREADSEVGLLLGEGEILFHEEGRDLWNVLNFQLPFL